MAQDTQNFGNSCLSCQDCASTAPERIVPRVGPVWKAGKWQYDAGPKQTKPSACAEEQPACKALVQARACFGLGFSSFVRITPYVPGLVRTGARLKCLLRTACSDPKRGRYDYKASASPRTGSCRHQIPRTALQIPAARRKSSMRA